MTKKNFRAIVALSLVILFVGVGILFFFNTMLPPDLNAFVEMEMEAGFTFIEILEITGIFLVVAAKIGLLFFAQWSRLVFAAGTVVFFIVTAYSGPFVATALETFINEVSLVLDGFIIALAYFSDVKVHFEKKST